MYTSAKCFWRAQTVATRKRRASKYVARAMVFDTCCRGGTGSNSARAPNEPHNYAKRMSAPSPRERGGRRREARNRQNATNAPPQNFSSCPSHALKCPGTTRVFRLLGANLGCPALYKDPLRGQGPAPLKEEGPRPRRGAAQWTHARHAKSAPRSRTPRASPGCENDHNGSKPTGSDARTGALES